MFMRFNSLYGQYIKLISFSFTYIEFEKNSLHERISEAQHVTISFNSWRIVIVFILICYLENL